MTFTQAEQQVIAAAQEFANGYLDKHSRQWEMARHMPREMFLAAAEHDLLGLLVRPDQGGSGLSYGALLEILERLARADMAAAFAIIVHNNHVRAIGSAGTISQIESYLPPMIAGSRAFAIKRVAAEKHPERFKLLNETLLKVYPDPAYKEAVIKTKAAWEFIKYGDADACAAYAKSMMEIGEQFKELLTGKS